MIEVMDNVVYSEVKTYFSGMVTNVYDDYILEIVDNTGVYKVLLWLKYKDFPIIQKEDELQDGNSF